MNPVNPPRITRDDRASMGPRNGPAFVGTRAAAGPSIPISERFWFRGLGIVALAIIAFTVGGAAVHRPAAVEPAPDALLEQLVATQEALTARTGELQLARIELRRMQTVVDYSRRYRIPADLAASIHDIAISEGVDPRLAFSLVRVESGFSRGAVSSAGAVGLTQVMPTTAFELQPDLRYPDLFERGTNLRLGFRYLRKMLRQFNGDLHLALLAYNRGPGTVDEIRSTGGDPSNGYSTAVIGGARLAGKARVPGKP
jgi:soluble lytic murein transglycosylase-like protein